jgi:hypothetical protein
VRGSVAVLLLVAFGCDREDTAQRPLPRPSAPPAGPSPGAQAVASLVASVRSRDLRLAAPGFQLQPFAFGKNLFVRLAGDHLEAYSMPSGKFLFEQPVDELRGVVEVAGGSAVIVATDSAFRVDPGAKEPVRLPAIPFLPGTVLVPDRKDSAALWSVHTVSRVLARHVLDITGKRSLDGVFTLADYDGGPVAAMRDGALVYRAEGGVRRTLPGGRARPLKSELSPWRLLPGRRVDQLWAVAADGRVELWQVGERIVVQARASLGDAPFDVAANAEYLAAIVVEEGAGKPRRFRLVVLSEKGDEVMREELPTEPPAEGERWAAIEGRNRHVALSEGEPLVAVGGPGTVRVLQIPGGAAVLSK